MRVFLIILSILVFRQSAMICMPSLMIDRSSEVVAAKIPTRQCQHSCCKKTQIVNDNQDQKDDQNSSNDCDQKCKCSSCKVISLSPLTVLKNDIYSSSLILYTGNGIKPISAHSYDFHAKISYPPQV